MVKLSTETRKQSDSLTIHNENQNKLIFSSSIYIGRGSDVRARASLFPEAPQDGIDVLKRLVDLSSLFSSWKPTQLLHYYNFINMGRWIH